MIFQAREGSTVWFDALTPSDLPDRLHKGISIHLRKGEVGIEAQGVVGAIPLQNGSTLQILPKVGRINFFRLLFKAIGLAGEFDREYADFAEYASVDEENIDQIVARSLFNCASEIAARGFLLARRQAPYKGAFSSGRIRLLATEIGIRRRDPEPIHSTIKERSCSTSENRVIGEALARAWSALRDKDKAVFLPILAHWTKSVPAAKDIGFDLAHVENEFSKHGYGGSRDYYRKPLLMAQVLLGSRGLGLSESADIVADSVLLNTADVFERYLRAIVSHAYSRKGYVITKGGESSRTLYTDGSFELKPDIVISRSGSIVLILDAKYKEPTADDHYQLNTYLSANNIKRGVILAPGFSMRDVQVKEYLREDQAVVRVVLLPMDDLNATEAFLSKVLDLAA